MRESNYASQFEAGKAGFLRGPLLQDWEAAAIKSYAALVEIRQSLVVFFVLLAANAGFRLVMMGNASSVLQSTMLADLGGFAIVGVLAAATFFAPRWWMVLITAIAIFPFALGIITGLMAIAFLVAIPTLKRANEQLYLSRAQYVELKPVFAVKGPDALRGAWTALGGIGKIAYRARFFDNAAVILAGAKPLNTMTRSDARQCVIEKNKKGQDIIKKWIHDGKLKNTNILLTEQGLSGLRQWMSGETTGVAGAQVSR